MSLAIEELRRQLRDRFPAAHASLRPAGVPEVSPEPWIFKNYPAGGLSEIVTPEGRSPLGLLVAGWLGEPGERMNFPDLVLVDGSDSLDPDSLGENACSRLLWVRCAAAMELVKAGELLIRDGNLPTILLDAAGLPVRALRQIPAAAWWRLKQAAEQSGCRVICLSPQPILPCAALRLSLSADFSLDDLYLSRAEVLPRVKAKTERLRLAN
ncbi:MAG: hypothetical protein MUF31_01210 [Akkermansiaceae bacterium]|jgi:hypothetical protein|nr:hypothetical protein [Akkermansiaceae bacterium]